MKDLIELLPEELFDEIDQKPNCELENLEDSIYQSQCLELMGNFTISLYIDENNCYYVKRSVNEPIGDYGHHWIDYWYKCNDNKKVEEILLQDEKPN